MAKVKGKVKILLDIDRVESLSDIFNDIKAVGADQLQTLANEVFEESQFSTLTFVPEK